MLESEVARPGDDEFLSQFGRAWSSRNEERLTRFYDLDAEYVDVAAGGEYKGAAEIARFFRYMLRFSSDSGIVFTSLVSDPRGFAAEWTWTGTANGELRVGTGLHAPTGRSFTVCGVAVCTVDARLLITRHRDYYDSAGLMRQIGVMDVAADPGFE